jgi:hypothetical protein
VAKNLRPGSFDEWAAMRVVRLYDAALRLLAALGGEPQFPADVVDLEVLLSRVGQDGTGEATTFAVEAPEELPRYSGRRLLWVSPAGEGRVRIRAEDSDLIATVALLSPDGRLRCVSDEEGFGVAESKLTDQARSDRDSVARLHRAVEAEGTGASQAIESERRFRAEHLRGVSAAPWQEPTGLVVTWVAFYEAGVVLTHLIPHIRDKSYDSEDEWSGERLRAMAMPSIAVVDNRGNEYAEVGPPRLELSGHLLRAEREYVPAVPHSATRLIVQSAWGSVDVEVRS